MEDSVETNRLSIVSLITGLVIPLSLGLYWVLFPVAFPSSTGSANPFILTIMDFSVSVRHFCAPVALFSGFLALRQIKKNAGIEKGRISAWLGIILGAGWIIFGMLVGMIFMLGEIPR